MAAMQHFSGLHGAQILEDTYAVLQSVISDYLAPEEQNAVLQAAIFGAKAHDGQKRQSGEPYFTHPIFVAHILATLKFDVSVIQAALLHDVMEDTSVTNREIEATFGEDIAKITEGVSKLAKDPNISPQEQQARSFLKMLLAVSEDPRVILVKLTDRLHNMMTLGALRIEKRQRIAHETMDVYVKMAEHLGLFYFVTRLVDLCFEQFYPWRAAVIKANYEKRIANSKIRTKIESEIQSELQKFGIEAQVSLRRRHLWEIYNRMLRKQTFEVACRTMTMRIVTKNEDDCYRVLGRVHNLYRPVKAKFTDFIAAPKYNGYRSLHTSVVRRDLPINVQIRSEAMNEQAEMGIIMTWYLKKDLGVDAAYVRRTSARIREWISDLRDLNVFNKDTLESYFAVKQEIASRSVVVYSPNGEVFELPEGATPVDFAYAIHSNIGNHCVAALVNGQDHPLHQPLESAQTVRILTAANAQPYAGWLNFVVTHKARGAIRQYFRRLSDEDAFMNGERLWAMNLQRYNCTAENIHAEFEQYLQRENLTLKEFFVQLGKNERQISLVMASILGNTQMEQCEEVLFIRSAQDSGVNLADCCYPLPYEELLARFDPDLGIYVHRKNCEVARASSRQDWVNVAWASEVEGVFNCGIEIQVRNRTGVLAEVNNVIAAENVNISTLSVDDALDLHGSKILLYWLEVDNVQQLRRLISKISAISDVNKVQRL